MRIKILIAILIFLGVCSVARAETIIYCPLTKNPLYSFKGDLVSGMFVKASDFKSLDVAYPDPIEGARMLCPHDGTPLNGFEYFFFVRGYNLPRMAYGAVTLLTKDEAGAFIWTPYTEEEMLNVLGE